MPDTFMTSADLLKHWQGHRGLTRRVIEMFPDEQFNTFAVGGMRPFGTMAVELLRMAAPTAIGIVADKWSEGISNEPRPKTEVLTLWDESTTKINELWPKIPAAKFAETVTAFGMYTGTVHSLVMYVIDNEIHHRGQGYVYLRALGMEPPPFWER